MQQNDMKNNNIKQNNIKEDNMHNPSSQNTPNSSDENLAWEEVSTELIVQDEWIDFRRSAYRFPDGTIFEPYYSYSRKDYVVIVATDENGNYLCVKQYRQGIGEVTTEFPAGGIEVKDKDDIGKGTDIVRAFEADMGKGKDIEKALEAAKRELREETGYESDEWEHLIVVPSNATIADNYAFIFTAKNCRKVSEQDLDDTEFLNVRKYTDKEIKDLVAKGKFQQAVHIMAWLMANRDI